MTHGTTAPHGKSKRPHVVGRRSPCPGVQLVVLYFQMETRAAQRPGSGRVLGFFSSCLGSSSVTGNGDEEEVGGRGGGAYFLPSHPSQ